MRTDRPPDPGMGPLHRDEVSDDNPFLTLIAVVLFVAFGWLLANTACSPAGTQFDTPDDTVPSIQQYEDNYQGDEQVPPEMLYPGM